MKNRNPQQPRLLLSRKDRLAALARIDPATAGVGDRQWPAVVDLLTQIELRTGRGGCHSYAGTLFGAMRNGVGVSEATFHRARRAAQAAGLLATQQRRDEHRQASNVWTIDWSRVAMLAGAADDASEIDADQGVTSPEQGVTSRPVEPSATPTSDRPGRRNDTPGCHHDTPNKGLACSSVSSSVVLGRLKATGKVSIGEEAERAARVADAIARSRAALATGLPLETNDRIAREFGTKVQAFARGPLKPADAELAWKLAAIAGVLGEAWLWSIVGAVRHERPRNVWGFVQTLSERGCWEHPGPGKRIMAALLKRTPKPIAGWPKRRDGPDFSRRLCVAGSDEV